MRFHPINARKRAHIDKKYFKDWAYNFFTRFFPVQNYFCRKAK